MNVMQTITTAQDQIESGGTGTEWVTTPQQRFRTLDSSHRQLNAKQGRVKVWLWILFTVKSNQHLTVSVFIISNALK